MVCAGNLCSGEGSLILLQLRGLRTPIEEAWGRVAGATGRAGCQRSEDLIRPGLEEGKGMTEGGWEAASFPSARFLSPHSFAKKSIEK